MDHPEPIEDESVDDVRIAPAARAFVALSTIASLAAFDLGFDLGAFENVDHRKVWAIWVLCTVALVSSYMFRDREYRLGGRWRLALGVPSLWLVADFIWSTESELVFVVLSLATVAALPFALYVLVRLVAGDFIELPNRLRVALVATALGVFAVGFYVGAGHERFLSCDDFELAGEFVPEDCTD